MSRSWLGASNPPAAGLILVASLGLVYEGAAYELWRTLLGMVLSWILVQKEVTHAGFAQRAWQGRARRS